MPRLTVGLPVYNGEEFIGEALDSLLAQTYTDFELLIADNASDDSTPEIIAEYAAADPRIRHVRHDRNLGSAGNFNHVLAAADTELFKWAAGDDLHAPTHIERCIAALDERSDLVGAHTRTMRIDEDSRLIKPEPYRLNTDGPAAHIRFRNVIAKPHSCFQSFGVFRTEMIQSTAGMRPYPGSDRVFLAEVSLHGPTLEIPDYLMFRRVHSGSHSATPELDQSIKVRFWAGDKAEPDESEPDEVEPTVPRLHDEYLDLTDTVPLEAAERRRCRREVIVSYTASELRSVLMRSVVYPVRKWMNSRRADRVEVGKQPAEPPLWRDYLEQVASGN